MTDLKSESRTVEERLGAAIFEVECRISQTDFPNVATPNFDDLGSPVPRQAYINRAAAYIAAAKEHGLVIGEGELDQAWKEAEAALPEGLSLLIGDERSRGKEGWWATASKPFDEVRRGYRIISSSDDSTLHPTPAAALHALAERLRR